MQNQQVVSWPIIEELDGERKMLAVPFEYIAPDSIRADTKGLAASGLRRIMARRDDEHGIIEVYIAPAGVESAGFVLGIERRAGA